MAKMMKTAERALHQRTNKMLASATKRYKKFMRQAAKAASEHKREQYLAAALSALVVTGVVASKLMANLEGKKAAVPGPARKNVRRRQINRLSAGPGKPDHPECPLWVKSIHVQRNSLCPLYPPKATFVSAVGMSAKGHKPTNLYLPFSI
ncbi:MAG TPA: hypothetical protein VHT68_24635 [Pseudolabrys sp.]|jgi:hypothetical protein|nr:hypothetical protein [Pseudolabrys sp.]